MTHTVRCYSTHDEQRFWFDVNVTPRAVRKGTRDAMLGAI
jgi:hypothetical protein